MLGDQATRYRTGPHAGEKNAQSVIEHIMRATGRLSRTGGLRTQDAGTSRLWMLGVGVRERSSRGTTSSLRAVPRVLGPHLLSV